MAKKLPLGSQRNVRYTDGMAVSDGQTLHISRQTIIFSVMLLLGLYFLFLIRDVLVMVFLAFILTVALNPATQKLRRWLRLSRFLSIVLTYLLFVGSVVAVFSFLLPPLLTELAGLIRFIDLPDLQAQFQSFKFSILELSDIGDQIGSSLTSVMTFLSSTFEGLFKVFTLVMLSLFMLLERESFKERLHFFAKHAKQVEQIKTFLREVELQLGGWLRGQIVMMILIGLVNYIGLTIIGVPYALPLALLAGLLEILPNLGPVLAAIPAILIALLALGPVPALIVLVFYIVVQQLESNLLSPKVIKDMADISPFMSVLSIIIGYTIAGIAGAFLALPTYIVLRVGFAVFVRDTLAQRA